jgi:hypothetical protein
MNIERLQPGDHLDLERTVTKTANGILPICTAVRIQAGEARKAQANSFLSSRVRGLVLATANDTDPVEVQVDGIFEATTGEWDAVTGQTGGLTEGEQYYLSPDTAGELTVNAPDSWGEFVVPVGVALSATELDIEIGGILRL